MSGSRWDLFGRTERLRQLRQTQLEQGAQLSRIERNQATIMANQADLEQEIQAVKASEQALLQRTAENAARLQTIIDGLQGQVPPDLQPQVDELKALQADMDAAGQSSPAAGGTPPA